MWLSQWALLARRRRRNYLVALALAVAAGLALGVVLDRFAFDAAATWIYAVVR